MKPSCDRTDQVPFFSKLAACCAFISCLMLASATASAADASIDMQGPASSQAPIIESVAMDDPYYTTSLLDTMGPFFYLPNDGNQRINVQFNWYQKNPEYLNRVFERSQRYLPYIVSEIQRRNIPMEFALLPVVESAFDPFAYSHGRAAGLWQFIPGTAKMFGLKQNWWYDGRRDPVASTNAALDYLEHLHKRLDGDWLLAAAAYNSGEGRVRGAVRRNKKKGLPTDFWNLELPRETRAYVPKLLAISQLVKNPWQYNIQLPFVSQQPYFAEVTTGGQIDLALAAELAGIDVQEIYRLNSGLNRWASAPDGPHRLMVPVAVASLLQYKLDQLPADQRVKWSRHKIKEGEALSTIASKYGTTVGVLREANSIKGTSIRAGHYLLIPSAAKNMSNYHLSADMREAKILSASNHGNNIKYTVSSGDSFWSIAKKHGVGTRQLARWNGMAPGDTLSIGKQLIVKGGRTAVGSATPASPDGTRRKIRYTVRRGDSLSRISSRFNVSVAQLKKWNRISGQKYLQPGQKISLYVDVTKQSGG